MVTPLIDFDILCYEIGFSCQPKTGLLSWDRCEEMLDKKIALICDEVRATTPPKCYFTNTPRINFSLNKRRKYNDEPLVEYVDNFRNAISTTGYKVGRILEKPFYFYSIIEYMLSKYDCVINEQGLEADDSICIEQYSRWKLGNHDTIICSRDKDLRQCPGNHYSWECGKQASIGPIFVNPMGELIHTNAGQVDAQGRKVKPKIFGTGHKFFYYQLLTGDVVDTIKGAKGYGPVHAFNLLKDLKTEAECFKAVSDVYKSLYGDNWKEWCKENANLIWMVRELNEDGSPKLWRPPLIKGI